VFSQYDFAVVVSRVWADVVPDHEAVIAAVVFGHNAVSWVASVAAGVWVGAIFLFVHMVPVFVSAPIAPSYVFVHLVGDVIWLSLVLEGHCGAPRAIIKEGGDVRGSFRSPKSVEHLLLPVCSFALCFEEVCYVLSIFGDSLELVHT
jgi:hypothetical protein